MRVYKCQCSLFKEFYGDYLKNKVDPETKAWMTVHKEECSFCNGWAKSFEENREDKVINNYIHKDVFDEAKKTIKKANIIISLSMIMMFAMVLWVSAVLKA